MIFVLSCKYEYNKLLLDRDEILNECKCNAKNYKIIVFLSYFKEKWFRSSYNHDIFVDVQYKRFNFGRSIIPTKP